MTISKTYIQQLQSALKQHKQLKNDIQSQKLQRLGLYQQAAEEQKPTIEAITKSNQETNKQIATISQAPPIFIPLDIKSSGKSYSLIVTTEIIRSSDRKSVFNIWRFNSKSLSNNGKWVLFSKEGIDYIWDYKYQGEEIILTEGLKEILFRDAMNREIIQDQDIANWETLIINSGLGSSYKNTNLYKRLESRGSTPIITEGEGIKQPEVIIIPSDEDKLRHDLILNLAACRSGNNNTFSTVNGIMKAMMEKKILKAKEYRDILRSYYRV